MIKHLAILASLTIAGPAWATCELPEKPSGIEKTPGAITAWFGLVSAQQVECRRKEAAANAAQERDDIHAIRQALEAIASRMKNLSSSGTMVPGVVP